MLIQPSDYRCRSILVRHHYGDGGLWIVNVEGATSGNEFHGARGAIVVSDMKRNRNPVATVAAALDCETEHPDNVPKASSLVLAGYVGWHGHISVVNCGREKHGESDAGLGGGAGNVHLEAVLKGLFPGVSVNDVSHVKSPF